MVKFSAILAAASITMALPTVAYVPLYHDIHVTFTGPTSAGLASVHYVEAGSPFLPTIVLYHGFPSSSNQYRDLVPMMASDYHVLALDLPGFGLTTVPDNFTYTFADLASVTLAWLDALCVESYAMYIFDYGAPVGLRVALQQPDKIKAIITQNGNAYVQGFGQPFWQPVFDLWNSSNSEAMRQTVTADVLSLAATEAQYTVGFPAKDLILRDPMSWQLDYLSNLQAETNQQHQLDLFYDYRTNVEMYPHFQQYFRESGVPILAVWGAGDPAFVPAGAEAFRADSPNATIRFVDAGHFALETKRWEIARIAKEWLSNIGY